MSQTHKLVVVNGTQVQGTPILREHPVRHVLILSMFLAISVVLYIFLIRVAPPPRVPFIPFLTVWEVCFLPYFAACIWILATKPLSGRRLWIELGIILVGALFLRVMLLNVEPGVSSDVWRYLWDGKVIAHGYSPYLYAPVSKVLQPLRDVVFENANWRLTTTKYPPGAELFYLLGYLITPRSILGLKSVFVLSDMITCGVLVALLMYKKLDPRRVMIYAWSPLPIVEFAIEGHSDVLAITFMVLAVLSATSSRRGARLLTGVFIGLATLIRLYPLILLFVLVRRRDWGLIAACAAIIVLGYLPFIILSQGQIFAFFSFIGQQEATIGVIQDEVRLNAARLHLSISTARLIERLIVFSLVAAIVPPTLILRWRKRISVEAALLILVGTILLLFSHIFPWYATALLPWITMLATPLWRGKHFSGKGLAIVMPWYFTSTVPLSYVMALQEYNTLSNASIYYNVTFSTVLVGLGVAAMIETIHFLNKRRASLDSLDNSISAKQGAR